MTRGLPALLAASLATQDEILDDDELEAVEDRMQRYAEGAPWTDGDVRLVWRSPAARAAYLRARRVVTAALNDRWRQAGYGQILTLRAADSEEDERVLEEIGISLRATRLKGMKDWLISVELTKDALTIARPGVRVRLSDEGGRVWAEGELDEGGGFDAYWGPDEESPEDRLRKFSVSFEFV